MINNAIILVDKRKEDYQDPLLPIRPFIPFPPSPMAERTMTDYT